MEPEPFAGLSERESEVMHAIVAIIDNTILDKELRDDLIGCLFFTVEEWWKEKLKKAPTDNPQ